jgi:hypothetical protein
LNKHPISLAVLAGTILSLALWSNAALADRRVALVIGNASYQNAPELPNPSADASAMVEIFKKAGFDVVDLQIDLNNLDYKRAIQVRRYSRRCEYGHRVFCRSWH